MANYIQDCLWSEYLRAIRAPSQHCIPGGALLHTPVVVSQLVVMLYLTYWMLQGAMWTVEGWRSMASEVSGHTTSL